MTIKEIAEALKVSTATVSNVIHGHLEKMSPETAERIRVKLEEYQYIPNMGARMLAKGASRIIGVITNYPNREEKYALQDPEPFARISGGTNEAMEFTVRVWCNTAYYWDLYFELNQIIVEAFGAKGVQAPALRVLNEKA